MLINSKLSIPPLRAEYVPSLAKTWNFLKTLLAVNFCLLNPQDNALSMAYIIHMGISSDPR